MGGSNLSRLPESDKWDALVEKSDKLEGTELLVSGGATSGVEREMLSVRGEGRRHGLCSFFDEKGRG